MGTSLPNGWTSNLTSNGGTISIPKNEETEDKTYRITVKALYDGKELDSKTCDVTLAGQISCEGLDSYEQMPESFTTTFTLGLKNYTNTYLWGPVQQSLTLIKQPLAQNATTVNYKFVGMSDNKAGWNAEMNFPRGSSPDWTVSVRLADGCLIFGDGRGGGASNWNGVKCDNWTDCYRDGKYVNPLWLNGATSALMYYYTMYDEDEAREKFCF